MNSSDDIKTDLDRVEPVSGLQVFRYHGRSMWPTFREGDLLIVKPIEYGKIRVGDCIVFQKMTDPSFIVHRVVTVRSGINTRGDNRPVIDDELVQSEWIRGKVTAVIRGSQSYTVKNGAWGLIKARSLFILRLIKKAALSADSRNNFNKKAY